MIYDISMIILIPGFLFAMYAQAKVSSNYKKYASIMAKSGISGAQFARRMLNDNGLNDVAIVPIAGKMSDHYDPRDRQVRLSSDVYNGTSIASLGIAAHEVGHAIQHATGYLPLQARNVVVPITNFSSNLYFPIILLGLFLNSQSMVQIGILLFGVIVLFQLITLPVEFNASNRAVKTLENDQVLVGDELTGVKKVLGAAAMTYVAALITALSQLLQFLWMFNHDE